MYAIMGITGRVGGAIAENLLAQGERIRAIVRNPEKVARWRDRVAEIAVADFDDPNALASAFEGTVGVFLMVPPNFTPAPGFRKRVRRWRLIMQLSQKVDGFNSGWIHFGVPGTEHITGATSLTSVIAKIVVNGNQEA